MTVTLLASFDGADGEDPLASLMFDSAGNLIGTANMGGANGDGTIFELQKTASGYADTPTVLAQLTERITGGIPYSYVLADSSGNLIVPIYGGGPGGYGTVLELAKSGTGYASPTVLASFNGSNGGFLNGGVLIDANGDILGSSWEGGTNGAGSVYEIAKTASGYASAPTVIAQFNGTDGLYTGPLVMDAAGNLFGGTLKGGPTGNGTLFEIQKTATGYASTPTVLFNFNGANGSWVSQGLIMDAAGDLFGTTELGGTSGGGVVFELAKTATGYAASPTILANFNGSVGEAALIMDAAGDLFGETEAYIFKIARTATGYAAAPTVVATLGQSDFPTGGLVADSQGNLYGVEGHGGATGDGAIFEITGAGYVTSPAESAAKALAGSISGAVLIQDSAADIQANLDGIEGMAKAGQLSSIALTDSGTPSISLSAGQFAADIDALGAISTAVSITLTDGAKPALALSAAQIVADLPLLAEVATPFSIHLTDGGAPTLSLTTTQTTTDANVLADISGSYSVLLQLNDGTNTIAGVPGAQGNTASFGDPASDYKVAGTGDGTSLTVTIGSEVIHVSGVQALQFTDFTEIVASQTAQVTGAVTSAQVTELYGAVFGRTPDVGGLSFYEKFAAQSPTTSLQTFATYFLDSGEYTSAHSYAQSAAGDQQFITDSYQNLLHRTPTASEVSYYETNVLAPAVANQTAGTPAYAAAQLQAHALMLVYFSASSEFLGDVQITASNPASAQHWLMLI